MTETQMGFLYKAAYSLQQTENNQPLDILRSYYLMRCQQTVKRYGLPEKHFSSKIRCSHCCIEWKKGTHSRVIPIKLSKKQRHNIRAQKPTKNVKSNIKTRQDLLHSNQVEQICLFCSKTTVTPALKPEKVKDKPTKKPEKVIEKEINKPNTKKPIKGAKVVNEKISEVNIYSFAKDVFSLKNNSNIVGSAVKQETKVIKNNKRKKDKYAGLCQKAVQASVKRKQEQNKLNLFLKPSG